MKRLWRIILAAVVVVIILLAIALLLIDQIARGATERGVSYATGVPTTLQSMDVSLLAGQVEMSNMVLANPADFTASPFLIRTGSFDVAVDAGSLFGQTIRVKHFILDGLELNIEQHLKGSNVSTVVDNLKRLGGPREEKPPSGKKVRVDQVQVRNVVARFYLPAELGRTGPVEVLLPEIQLNDVASDESGVAIAELTRRLLAAVLAAVAQKAQGVVPPEVLALLNSNVGELTTAIGAKAVELVNQARDEAMGRVGEQATEAIEKGKETLEQETRDRIKGLFDKPK